MSDSITITMTDGRYIEGTPHAPGDRVKVPAHVAHEVVANGWARFTHPEDAEVARRAFVAEQTAMLRRVNGNAPPSFQPWRH